MDSRSSCDDVTVIATPVAKACTTKQRKTLPSKPEPINEAISDSDESLGVLSVKSVGRNVNSLDSYTITNDQFKLQCSLANDSLQRPCKLTSLPSCYYKPSSIPSSTLLTNYDLINDESTVSESDFSVADNFKIPNSDTSTPRISNLLLKTNHESNSSLPKHFKVPKSHTSTPLHPNLLLKTDRESIGSTLSDSNFSMVKPFNVPKSDTSTPLHPNLLLKTGRESIGSTLEESNFPLGNHFKVPKSDTSTPRPSNVSLKNGRESIGKSLHELSRILENPGVPVDYVVKEFQKQINPTATHEDSEQFTSAEKAEEKLLSDELSWKRERDIPAISVSNFSIDRYLNDESMGTYFKKQSDDISNIIPNIPVENKEPIALIDTFSYIKEEEEECSGDDESNSSLSISAIGKILSDTSKTPGKCTNLFLNQGNERKQCRLTYNAEEKSSILNKENVNPIKNISPIIESKSSDIDQNKSLISTRSSSSLSSLPDGKLPIEATKCEIVWGCVKIGKSVSQDFVMRNKSTNRLKIQCTTSGQSFKIVKDRSESDTQSVVKFILHSREVRCITICFAPTQIGAAVEEINFTSFDHQHLHSKKQSIRLFGYGGYGNVEIQQISKDTTGRFWLPLGLIENREVVKKSFALQNVGDLASFVLIKFISKGVFSAFNVTIYPNCFVLIPQEQQEIVVTYSPMKSDINNFQNIGCTSSIVEMGNLQIVSGTEANRGRIRRLCLNALDRGMKISEISHNLKEKFIGEIMPPDIIKFQESTHSLEELLHHVTSREIVVTLEQDPDHTLVAQFPDETSMFQTLCQENSLAVFTPHKQTCRVEPSNIMLVPPTKIEDVVFLSSADSEELHYEAKSIPEGLDISPTNAVILPGETVVLKLKCATLLKQQENFKVMIYLDNDVLQVDVRVILICGKSKN